jgi:uncharacterized protein (TIGR03790 family)
VISPAKVRHAVVAALLLVAFPLVAATVPPPADAPEAQRVIIVANAADSDSRALANYYAAARGIPADNIVALPMPANETVAWPEFVSTVFNPLFAELVARGWIDAMPSRLTDDFGRRKAVISGHRISYLVLMRGVPLRIDENPLWKAPPGTPGAGGGLACNHAAVDGELALLAASGTPVLGVVPNPLYGQRRPGGPLAESVVRVARLDGPTPASVREMVDNALVAEKQGLIGRAYVDIGGMPHPEGNNWLEGVARQLAAAGYETDVDRATATFPPLARFDAPALYFGWYDWNVGGPFTVPGFRFPPGAVAVHIHSFSAETLRGVAKNWCGPFIVRGVTATLGNVHEPYLGLTHHLDTFTAALLRGETFGAAAYLALPGLSWQATAVGDPLYRPFAHPAGEQFAERETLPSTLRPYVVLRQARNELAAGRQDEALRLVRAIFRDTPSIALGVSLAQLERETAGPVAAVRALGFLEMVPRYELGDVGAVRSAAVLLTECGEPARALSLYEKALVTPPPVGEVELLEEAIRTASQAGLPARAAKWQDRLTILKPPPPPAAKK